MLCTRTALPSLHTLFIRGATAATPELHPRRVSSVGTQLKARQICSTFVEGTLQSSTASLPTLSMLCAHHIRQQADTLRIRRTTPCSLPQPCYARCPLLGPSYPPTLISSPHAAYSLTIRWLLLFKKRKLWGENRHIYKKSSC